MSERPFSPENRARAPETSRKRGDGCVVSDSSLRQDDQPGTGQRRIARNEARSGEGGTLSLSMGKTIWDRATRARDDRLVPRATRKRGRFEGAEFPDGRAVWPFTASLGPARSVGRDRLRERCREGGPKRSLGGGAAPDPPADSLEDEHRRFLQERTLQVRVEPTCLVGAGARPH